MVKAKACLKCGVIQPLSEFYKEARGADGLRARCKTCLADAKIARLYPGFTTSKKDEMFAQQGNSCGYCGGTDPGPTGWHIDHDHETNWVRTISHGTCNRGIGSLGDTVQSVLRAAYAMFDMYVLPPDPVPAEGE